MAVMAHPTTDTLDDDTNATVEQLDAIARKVRALVMRMVTGPNGGHPGGSLSATDILVALYFSELNVRTDDPRWEGRDRFVHSKGHASEALYATLALRGFLPVDELKTFGLIDSRLQGHPDMTRLDCIDMSSGALGVGFSAGVGMALGSRLRGTSERTYVLLGDGECQEGQVWEAAWVSGRYGLDNLVAIVDFNSLQQIGWPGKRPGMRAAPWAIGPFARLWAASGWFVQQIDGHDTAAILTSLAAAREVTGRPSVVIARTVKGKGVSYMEGNAAWHARIPTADELSQALEEIGEAR